MGSGKRDKDGSSRHASILDWILVSLGVLFVRFFSGSERSTFLHTPDSEFYLSLGAFSDDITDRAPNDGYYWTKLGIILPVRALTYLLPAQTALSGFHFLLLLLLFGASYRAARIGLPRSMSTAAALFVTLNTVVLGFLGDPYAVGAAIAALSVLYCCMLVWLLERATAGWVLPAAVGSIFAWLILINPYAAFLGGFGIAGLCLANLPGLARARPLDLVKSTTAFAVASSVSLVAVIKLGEIAFPGLNWFETVRDFAANSDLAIWAEPNWGWLATETSLLVPVLAALVAAVAVWRDPRSALARSGAALAGLPLLVAGAYKVVTSSNVLETGLYNSILWPGALLGILAGIASCGSLWRSTRVGMVLLVLCPATWIMFGHWSGTATPTLLGLSCGAVCLIAGASMVLSGGQRAVGPQQGVWATPATLGLIPLLFLGSLFQILQNGRPAYPESIHPRVEYELAFLPNDSGITQERNLHVQEWLLSETSSGDSVLVSAEIPHITAAAMQLWGPNAVGSVEGGLGEAGLATLRAQSPTVLVTYSSSRAGADALSEELASRWAIVGRQCRHFPASGLPDLVVCLNHLGNPL